MIEKDRHTVWMIPVTLEISMKAFNKNLNVRKLRTRCTEYNLTLDESQIMSIAVKLYSNALLADHLIWDITL